MKNIYIYKQHRQRKKRFKKRGLYKRKKRRQTERGEQENLFLYMCHLTWVPAGRRPTERQRRPTERADGGRAHILL